MRVRATMAHCPIAVDGRASSNARHGGVQPPTSAVASCHWPWWLDPIGVTMSASVAPRGQHRTRPRRRAVRASAATQCSRRAVERGRRAGKEASGSERRPLGSAARRGRLSLPCEDCAAECGGGTDPGRCGATFVCGRGGRRHGGWISKWRANATRFFARSFSLNRIGNACEPVSYPPHVSAARAVALEPPPGAPCVAAGGCDAPHEAPCLRSGAQRHVCPAASLRFTGPPGRLGVRLLTGRLDPVGARHSDGHDQVGVEIGAFGEAERVRVGEDERGTEPRP